MAARDWGNLRRVGCRILSVVVSGVAPLLLCAPASAQGIQAQEPVVPIRDIEAGGPPLPSAIEISDPQVNGRHTEDYRVTLAAGDSLQADMEATARTGSGSQTSPVDELDPFLSVLRPGEEVALASNDDRTPNVVDSRVFFIAPTAGSYLIRAQGLGGTTGAYSLTVRRLAAQPRTAALPPGGASGTLGEASAVLVRYGQPLRYDLYTLDGTAGQRIRLDMTSADLDSLLELVGPDNEVLGADDNGGGGANARIYAMLPRTGQYRVRAGAPAVQAGPYRLELTPIQVRAAAGPELRRDQPLVARLGFDSIWQVRGPLAQIDFLYQLVPLRVRAGEIFTVDLIGYGFDPVLDAGVVSILGFAYALTNDDGGDGLNSRLVIRPVQTGIVYLRVRSLGLGTGCFKLQVTQGAIPASTQVAPSRQTPSDPLTCPTP